MKTYAIREMESRQDVIAKQRLTRSRTIFGRPYRYGIYDMDLKYKPFWDELKKMTKEEGIRPQDLVGELIISYVTLERGRKMIRED